jgi:hypothetical protein
MAVSSNYYLRREFRFMLEFDLVARPARSVAGRYYGDDVNSLIAEMRREFENLIPQFPYIGGKQPFTEFIVFTAMLLAMYRVNKVHGKTVEQTGEMMYEIGRAFLRSYSAILVYLFGRMNFSSRYLERVRKGATESQQRKYPEGYVIGFVEGDGETFDYGVDYIECASCKFLAKHGAPELAPYLCPVDILFSDALGWGLTRTTTLAEGAEKCDFRFKKGGKTNIAVPVAMQAVVSRSK